MAMKKLLLGVVLVVSGFASGSDLYFSVNNDALKYWDYAAGWKANSGTPGVLPTAADTVTFNSSYLNLAAGRTPMAITNDVAAVCGTFRIATSKRGSGSSFADDGRVIGVRMTGGSLTTHQAKGNDIDCSVGDNAAGYGVLEMTGGALNAFYTAIGRDGIGVLTNAGGRINLACPNEGGYPRLSVGHAKGSKGSFAMSAGVIAATNAAENWRGQVWIGNNGMGHFDFTGGVISNGLIVGKGAGGSGTMNWAGGRLESWFNIGYSSGSTGVVTMTKGEIKGEWQVGVWGDGTLTVTGDVTRAHSSSFIVGYRAGSTGQLFLKPTKDTLATWKKGSLYSGILGTADVEVSGDILFGWVKIGATNSVCSTMRVLKGATLGVEEQLSVGSYPIPSGVLDNDGNVNMGGRGECRLAGGTVKFVDSTKDSQNFFLGRYADEFPGAFGILRGWGTIAPAWTGATNVRMAIGDGQVIADGGGEERTLDLGQVVNVTNLVANGASSTNGWYAVNKGAVLFPRTWFGQVSPATRCFGATPYGSVPDFVNSIQLTMRGVTSNDNYFRGGVYASDRSDVHVDALPSHAAVVGIWKLGNFSSVDGTGRVGFTSIDLTFRYDQTRVAENRTLALYRWNDATSSWDRLAGGAPAADHRISVTGLAPQATDGYNVGLFALVAREPGMTLLVR